MHMTPAEFVKIFPAFRASDRGLLEELMSSAGRQPLPPGAQIYREGDPCSAIAFVLWGEIRVFKIGETGREITLYEIGPGETCILNASSRRQKSGGFTAMPSCCALPRESPSAG